MEQSIVWREVAVLMAFEDSIPVAFMHENGADTIFKAVRMSKQDKRDLLSAINVE